MEKEKSEKKVSEASKAEEKESPLEREVVEKEEKEEPQNIVSFVFTRVFVIAFVTGLGQLFAFFGDGDRDILIGGDSELRVLQTTAIISFLIQFVMFIPSYLFQTEKFYDLTGALTFICCTTYSLLAGAASNKNVFNVRAIVMSSLTYIWCLRLGSFLFLRVLSEGKDSRFDEIKTSFWSLLMTWSLQGLWVFLTAYPVFIVNSDQGDKLSTEADLLASDFIGLFLWILGFLTEVIADHQKSQWRHLPKEEKPFPFITVGLWKYSRHPNYFGEMLLWFGMFILSIGSLDGKQFTAFISPLFVFALIYFVSGVKMSENGADKKFEEHDEYWEYKRKTSVLIPLPKGVLGAKNAQRPGAVRVKSS